MDPRGGVLAGGGVVDHRTGRRGGRDNGQQEGWTGGRGRVILDVLVWDGGATQGSKCASAAGSRGAAEGACGGGLGHSQALLRSADKDPGQEGGSWGWGAEVRPGPSGDLVRWPCGGDPCAEKKVEMPTGYVVPPERPCQAASPHHR